MTEYKISQSEIDSNNVKSAPTHNANEEPQVNKHIFDKLPELIADKHNRFVDAVYTKAETEAVIDERMQQAGSADMQQAVYDKNHNGVVDDAERLGGHLPEYFASQDTAVLKTGGAFTGDVAAYNGNRATASLRNTEVRITGTDGELQSTNKIIMVRK